jgi:hypothetical protein
MKRMFPLAFIALGAGLILIVSHVGSAASSNDILTVKERNESWLLSLPNVVGVGIGECDGQPCIKVYVMESTPDLTRQIPRQIEGYTVDIEVTGPITILPA